MPQIKITQMQRAASGEITEEIRRVAESEFLSPEELRKKVAAGTVVIPANIHHPNLVPMGIGKSLRTKINANIGNSSPALSLKETPSILNVSMPVLFSKSSPSLSIFFKS